MIKNNKVTKFLKSKGYRFIHFSSGWGATDHNKYADLDIWCGRGNEFLMVLFQTTMLRPLERYLISYNAREGVLCTFSKLAKIHMVKSPKFVFAHINCPHPPYLFGANGEMVPEAELEMSGKVWEEKEQYVNQLLISLRIFFI